MPGMPLQVTCFERADDIGHGRVGRRDPGARDPRSRFRTSIPRRSRWRRRSCTNTWPTCSIRSAPAADRPPCESAIGSSAFCGRPAAVRHDAVELPFIPDVPAQGRWLRVVARPVHAVGRRSGDGQRRRPGLAGYARSPRRSRGQPRDRRPAGRSGRRSAGRAGRRVHAGHGRARGAHGRRRRSGWRGRAPARRALRHAGGPPRARLGRRHEDGRGSARRQWSRAGHGVPHASGIPEPEIFGFLYVNDARTASLGIFVPSWFDSPVRTAYRYLQHWMLHPYLWRYLEGGRMRSWGAKSLQESGKRGEPFLAGDGYARIGEGFGQHQRADRVRRGRSLDDGHAARLKPCSTCSRRASRLRVRTSTRPTSRGVARSWVEHEGRVAERARDGFHKGVLTGLLGMGLAGLTGGRLFMPVEPRRPHERVRGLHGLLRRADSRRDELERIQRTCAQHGPAASRRACWTARAGPPIPFDGALLVSHQDALLMGGKVQAAPGYADHVLFHDPALCATCRHRLCIEICSGQALMPGPERDARPSIARSAFTAARVTGAARSRCPGSRTGPTSSSAPVRAGCTRRRIRQE